MKKIRIINYISSSTFMIYLLHDNDFFRNVLRETNWIEIYYNSIIKYISLYLMWIAIIFGIGILLYTIYYLILKVINTKFVLRSLFNNTSKDL